MKRLLFLLLAFMPLIGNSQSIINQGATGSNVNWLNNIGFKGYMKLPVISGSPGAIAGTYRLGLNGLMVYDSTNKITYVNNGSTWVGVGGGGADRLSTKVFYFSKEGVSEDNVNLELANNTDGPDRKNEIQAVLRKAKEYGNAIIVCDVHVSSSGDDTLYKNTTLIGAPGCGVKLISFSNKTLFRNANYTYGGYGLPNVDSNITIQGGIWNGNGYSSTGVANQLKFTNGSGIAGIFTFVGVTNLTIRDAQLLNQPVYAVSANTIKSGLYENLIVKSATKYTGGGATNTDGLHFDGWSNSCVIRNCKIRSIDDAIGINMDDLYHAGVLPGYTTITPYQANGPTSDILLENVTLDSGLYGVRFYGGGDKGNNFKLNGLHGVTSGYALIIDNYKPSPSLVDVPGAGYFGRITLEDIDAKVIAGSYFDAVVAIDANIDELNVRSFSRTYYGLPNFPSILYDGAGKHIKRFNLTGYNGSDSVGTTTPHIYIKNGTVDYMSATGSVSNVTSNNSPFIKVGGTIRNLSISGLVADNINNVVEIASGGQVDRINAPGMMHINADSSKASILNNSTNPVSDVCMSAYTGYKPVGGTGTFTKKRGDAFATAAMGDLPDLPITVSYLLFDDFNRANSSSTLGNAVTPNSAWSVESGTWGINSNQAYCVSTTTSGSLTTYRAFKDAGASTYTFEADVTFNANTSEGVLLPRYVDASNYVMLDIAENNNATFYTVVGGTLTQISSTYHPTFSTGTPFHFKINVSSTGYTTYLNGTLIPTLSITDNSLNTSTKIGMGDVSGSGYGGGMLFDNYKVY